MEEDKETNTVSVGENMDSEDFSCEKCDETFDNAKDLENHGIMHVKNMYCPICKCYFKIRDQFVAHVRGHVNKTLFLCKLCDKGYKFLATLNKHMKIHGGREYICEGCGEDCKDAQSFTVHKFKHGGSVRRLGCPIPDCKSMYRRKHLVKDHLVEVHNLTAEESENVAINYIFYCQLCEKKYLVKSLLYEHLKKDHVNDQFKCRHCDQVFTTYFSLEIHIEMVHHKDDDEVSPDLKEAEVKVEQIDAPEMVDVGSSVTNENKFECEKCRKGFECEEDLAVHNIIHTNDNYCPLCKKLFAKRSSLCSHVKIHFTQKDHKCGQCLKMFVTARELKLHMRVHTDERPYQCNWCPKKFKQLSSLADHKTVHSKVKKSVCPIKGCSLLFTTTSSARRHVRRIHKEDPNNFFQKQENSRVPSQCGACGKQFHTKTKLLEHEQLEHGNEEFKCEDCDEEFTSVFTLNIHKSDVHTPKTCGYCGISFKGLTELQEHSKKHFHCEVCDEFFPARHFLLKHLKSCGNKIELSCPTCNAKFTDDELFKAHLPIHQEGKKEFFCGFCDKGFDKRPALIRHMRLFHNSTSYNCKICNRYFISESTLQIHLDVHKRKFDKVAKKEFIESVKCQYCGWCAITVPSHKKHATLTCKKKDDFKCHFCDEEMPNFPELKLHYNENHSEKKSRKSKTYKCDFCDEETFDLESWKKHFEEKHSKEEVSLSMEVQIKEEMEEESE